MKRAISLLVVLALGLACSAERPVSAARAQDPIKWTGALTAKAPAPGKPFEAGISARIDKGWHLYALQEPVGGPPATVIVLTTGAPFSLNGEITGPTPTKSMDTNWNLETEYYEDEVTFSVPLKTAANAKAGRYIVKITATYVTCDDHICLPPQDRVINLTVDLGGVTTPVPGFGADPPAAAAASGGASGSSASSGAATTGVATNGSASTGAPLSGTAGAANTALATTSAAPRKAPIDMAASSNASTLGAYIGLAAVMGALSLLTPCVFPMVPITVSYFTNRARKSRAEAVGMALVYGLGIILTFTAVGFTLAIGFGASGLNRFAADPWLNLGVTAMFLAFAMSLFGVWEIALPSKLVTAASKADSGKGQIAGTLLMGLAFTLTSFTCTAPFLGSLLVLAAQGDWQWPLAGMLAFSGVFALPFVILALVPQMLASLPRSGPWLIAVKAVMGIVEIAAAMKFLSNADLVWGWHIFTRPVVLVTWVVLSIVLVVYLAGFARLGPVPKLRRPGPARWVLVAATLVLALWLGAGVGGRRLGELESFLPPADLSASEGELSWKEYENDYAKALTAARAANQRIFIDFTGYTCTNCRWMEANMFTRPDVARELSRYIRVRLYTDGKGEMYRNYQEMEKNLFKTVALPLYAVMDPDGEVLVYFSGLTRDPNQFVNFLQTGLR